MIEHIVTAAPAVAIEGGRILGTVGSGGIATALTVVLVAGTREPKGGGGAAPGSVPSSGAKKSRIRKRLTSEQAQWTGITAGTFYMTAGSIWSVGEQVSSAFAGVFTNGGFGVAGLGSVSLGLAALMYFREFSPGKSALLGILTAGVWATAGGVWGLPRALILTGAQAIGLT